MINFKVCYNCRRVWCNADQCLTPKCGEECTKRFKKDNVYYVFCTACEHKMALEFERQLGRRRLLPSPKLRLDEEK